MTLKIINVSISIFKLINRWNSIFSAFFVKLIIKLKRHCM